MNQYFSGWKFFPLVTCWLFVAACFRSKRYWCSEDDCVITMLIVVLKCDVVDVDVEVDVVVFVAYC